VLELGLRTVAVGNPGRKRLPIYPVRVGAVNLLSQSSTLPTHFFSLPQSKNLQIRARFWSVLPFSFMDDCARSRLRRPFSHCQMELQRPAANGTNHGIEFAPVPYSGESRPLSGIEDVFP
jgi:hypothetical protein